MGKMVEVERMTQDELRQDRVQRAVHWKPGPRPRGPDDVGSSEEFSAEG